MVQVIRPVVVTERVTTQTVHGEVTINLNLTITVQNDGTVQVGARAAAPAAHRLEDVPDSVFAIPEFETTEILEGFGEQPGW